jgi:hypothetical protein
MTQPKTREEAIEYYRAQYPEAVQIAVNDDGFCVDSLKPWKHSVCVDLGSAGFRCQGLYDEWFRVHGRDPLHVPGFDFRSMFTSPRCLVWKVGEGTYVPAGPRVDGKPPQTQPIQPQCRWNNKQAPDLNITYPTRPASMSPWAEESYHEALVAAEDAGLKRARRVLREYPVCHNEGGLVDLGFKDSGEAYWSCDCAAVAAEVKPRVDTTLITGTPKYFCVGQRVGKTLFYSNGNP